MNHSGLLSIALAFICFYMVSALEPLQFPMTPVSRSLQDGKGDCDALIEVSPWHVSSVVVRNTPATAETGSSIHFHISDTNPGLEFETCCWNVMPSRSSTNPADVHGWFPCEDKRVRFLYRLGHLQIRRSYIDDWYIILPKKLQHLTKH